MASIMVGESLVGDGNEVAHIDLMIGRKDGPVGIAFANRLAAQTAGHNGLLAVLEPNLPAKPDTVMFNKVTIKGATQAVQMFGPAQMAVAKAVADSVAALMLAKLLPSRIVASSDSGSSSHCTNCAARRFPSEA